MKVLNLDALQQNGHKWKQVPNKEIYIIEDFLKEDERKFLYDYLENLTSEEMYNAYVEQQIKPQALERYGTDDLDTLEKDGIISNRKDAFDYYWADKIYFVKDISKELLDTINTRLKNLLNSSYDFRGLATIQKHGKDQFLGYHYDNAFQTDIEFAVALYINDNYEGGELHFPLEKDLERNNDGTWKLTTDEVTGIVIQPKAGNLLIFSTTGDYVHGVRSVVGDSNRYAIVSFIRPE